LAVDEGVELLIPVALATRMVVVEWKLEEELMLLLLTSVSWAVTEGVLEIEAEDELVPALILNGNEYWKVDGSESRVSLNP